MESITKYGRYKPSGIDWIGEVPEHWEIKRLKDVANVTLGKMLQNDDSGSDELKPYLRSFNVQWDRVDLSEIKEMWLSEYEQELYRLRKFDLVVSEGGEVGRCAIWLDEIEECYIQNSVHKVTSNKRILPYFLHYQFTTAGRAGFFEKIINKVSIGHLTREKLVAVSFVIPPVSEQLAIANNLNDQIQKIYRLIANKKAQAEKLKELRQIEINNAVTKGLNPNAELKESGIEWLGKIPKHWEVNRLKNTTYINQSVIPEKTTPDFIIKYIDISNVNSMGEFIELQEMEFSEAPSRARRIPKHNSILLSTVRTYLRAIALVQNPDINLIASTGFAVIDAKSNLFDAKYLYFQMISHILVERVIANSEGVSYPAISSTKLEDIKIVIPPKEEQIEIANYLRKLTAAIDQLIKNIEAQIEKLQELRKITIYEAVTGKIQVNAYAETTA